MFGIKRLRRENAAMREALLWYAAQETWRRKGIHQKGAPRKRWKKSPAAFDRGHLAVRVLTEIDEPRVAKLKAAVPAPVRKYLTPAAATADVLARGPGMDTE